jgi:hypothetical protein
MEVTVTVLRIHRKAITDNQFTRRKGHAMEDLLIRVWQHLIDRISGPLNFRVFVQPAMAAFFAIRAGLKDAQDGCPPYFWTIFSDPEHRMELVRSGWKSVARVFIIAVIIDTVYQIIVVRWFYPGETLIVATVLVVFPYLLIRGAVNRIARRAKGHGATMGTNSVR